MPNRRNPIILLLALAWVAGAHADAFKCRTSDGKVVISNTSCQEGSKTLAVQSGDAVTPEQRLQAEREVERQRKFVAEQEAVRSAKEEREQKAQRKLAGEESSRRTLCLQNAEKEPDPQFRADLIAACNGVAPQRPVVVQQPVLIPLVPARTANRPGLPCVNGDCRAIPDQGTPRPTPQTPPAQTRSSCRQVGNALRCD